MNIRIMLKLLSVLRELRSHETWSREQLAVYQAQELKRLREFAYERSPFYQQFHKGLTTRSLQELPVLTKAVMMEHFNEIVTNQDIRLEEVREFSENNPEGKRFLDRFWVNATSGSSGHPGFFLFDQAEWIYVLASFARSQEWSGVQINLTHRQPMATVASISPWHMSSQVSATVKSWWRPSLRLPASQSLSQTVDQLNDWQPEVLITYASMAGILAEEQHAGRLHIHPQEVYAASEVLTSQTRQRVREVWGDEPFNQYVSTEAASIAAEYRACRHMHFLEDLVLTEVVDENYRPVPPGEFGTKVLITTLFSRTQPLIRYELNDSVRVSAEPHTCGLPFMVLDGVQGRVEDALQLPAAKGGRVAVQPLVFNRVMDIVPVVGWQVAQQADDGLLVLLAGVQDGLADETLVDQLTLSLAQEGVHTPYITVQRVASIPKTAAGKAPLIKAYHHQGSRPQNTSNAGESS